MDRTTARAAAMKLIYEWEMGGDGGADTRLGMLEIEPGESEADYMEKIVSGIQQQIEQIDALIEKYAVGWKLNRITRVDLSILRLAVYEILFTDLPEAVAINEAVELAHQYSTQDAGTFINGVLGNLARTEK